jgi:glutathione S-transferase
MTWRIYGGLQTGAMAVEAAMAEAGLPCEIIDLDRDKGERSSAAFTAINPRQQVPALVAPDGTVVTEGPAILSFIADSHPGCGLIPTPGSAARARHDRWTAFFHANVYEGMLREAYADRYADDPGAAPAVARAATAYVRRHFELFEQELGPGPYLLGDTLQMFDIYLWMLCWWMEQDWLAAHCPRIHRLMQTANARPALAAVAARHFG